MEIIFDKINADSLIQIGLIIVFIIQTWYLIRQTNFGKRSSQANLTEDWMKEYQTINMSLLSTNLTPVPDEVEFVKLMNIFDRMHPLLRQKLLKPSDFAEIFIKLYDVTENETFRKTKSYMENYLKLQNIFHEFNKDIDVMMIYFNTSTTSEYRRIFKEEMGRFKMSEVVQEWYLRHWVFLQMLIKPVVLFNIKIRRSPFFELEEPVT